MTNGVRKEIGHAEDDTCGDYEWGYTSICEENGLYIAVSGSGCSCGSPELDQDDVILGPAATLGGLFDQLFVDKDKHSRHTKDAFLDALRRINQETLDAATKALA